MARPIFNFKKGNLAKAVSKSPTGFKPVELMGGFVCIQT